MIDNPFYSGRSYCGEQLQAVDVESRLRMLKSFDIEQCRMALQVQGLQKTVAVAAERRIRKLSKAQANSNSHKESINEKQNE